MESDAVGDLHRPIGWRDVVAPIGVMAGLFVSFVLLMAIAILIAKLSCSHKTEIDGLMQQLKTGFWSNNLLGDLFYVALLAFLLPRGARLSPASLMGKFSPPPLKLLAAATALGAFFALLVITLVSQLVLRHAVQFHETARDRLLQTHSLLQLLALFATVSVLAPLAEEIYFRNFLLSLLKRKFGLAVALVVSASLFALVHFQFIDHPGVVGWVTTGLLFGLGLINALWVARTGLLWLAIASHAAYNSVLVVLPFALLAVKF